MRSTAGLIENFSANDLRDALRRLTTLPAASRGGLTEADVAMLAANAERSLSEREFLLAQSDSQALPRTRRRLGGVALPAPSRAIMHAASACVKRNRFV